MPLPAIPPETLLVANIDGELAAVRDPITGEVIELSDVHRLADWKLALKEHRRALTEASQLVDSILIEHMDRDASWTINRPGGTVASTSPARGVAADQWDGPKLHDILSRLVDEGTISKQALAAAVKIETEYVPIAKGVKALLSLPDVAPYIESCRASEVEPKKRSVTVK